MESWFHSYWIYLLVLFRDTWAEEAPLPRYAVHLTRASFDLAAERCAPGVLTTLATEQELADILGVVSRSVSPLNQGEFTFWVGLRKVKNECVVPARPLRGFKWTEDGSEESQVSRWAEEPKLTCTTVRCAALQGELDGSTVARWGLIPVSCKSSYQFICKLRGTAAGGTPDPPAPATPEPHKPEPTTQKPQSAAPEPELPTKEPEATSEVTPEPGPEPHGPDPDRGSDPAAGSGSCERPVITSARSLSLDPDNSSRIQVECWSDVRLELQCLGRPAIWRMLDDSPANFSTICQPCGAGFEKDPYGVCVDVDECGGAPCRHTCLNTLGSYKCFCSNETGKHHDQDSPECQDAQTAGDNSWLSEILMPVLVAVGALVLLVLLVALVVKCCVRRRSKKRAMRKAEKMALRSKDDKDSFEAEKAAI